MTGHGTSWVDKIRRLGGGPLAIQAAVLLAVLAITALTAWTMLSAPTKAQSPADHAKYLAQQDASRLNPVPAPALQQAALGPPEQTSPAGPPAVNGLKISSQSWRRGGLGSNALVTFTLRNDNDFAVKDIEIACTFSRSDGSRLTERKRVIPDAVVNMKSRKTFARMHVGYVNIDANKAKCAPVAANRI